MLLEINLSDKDKNKYLIMYHNVNILLSSKDNDGKSDL